MFKILLGKGVGNVHWPPCYKANQIKAIFNGSTAIPSAEKPEAEGDGELPPQCFTETSVGADEAQEIQLRN